MTATGAWLALLVIGLLWPARTLGALDGLPLSHAWEALAIGLAVPALAWLHPGALVSRPMRGAIVALLVLKAFTWTMAPEGLCARFTTNGPLAGTIQTIPVEEPSGVLRSWDVRAGWRDADPACTAVFDRSYGALPEFPVWFLNLLDYLQPGRDLRMSLDGHVTVAEPGTLSIVVGDGMPLSGTIADVPINVDATRPIDVALQAGTHVIRLRGTPAAESWGLRLMWNGEDAWRQVRFTTQPPASTDVAAPFAGALVTTLVALILAGWCVSAAVGLAPGWMAAAWLAASSIVLAVLAAQPGLARLAPAILPLAALVRLPTRLRNVRGAFLLVGLPWLVYLAVLAAPQAGRVTVYSADDWLTYQVAGYRIVMHGFWIEGGTPAFDYQPLYRWMTGVLHIVYGDSSIGELLLDGVWLLVGGLLAYQIARPTAGFRLAIAAAAATLATYTLGTVWYFPGRGLSEIAAAGWGFLGLFLVLRARRGSWGWAAAAAACAVLMFYTRLNHLIFALFFPVMLLGLRTSSAWRDVRSGLNHVRWSRAAIVLGGFVFGVFLFMTRTWAYTGVFALFHGTSLRHNDTGLRPWTVLDADVWRRVGHSLAQLVFMNEPPRFDARALIVVIGTLLAAAAAAQVPGPRRLPVAAVLICLGATMGSFLAHTHHYPGRLSVHLVPLAAAIVAAAAGLALNRRGVVHG